MPKKQVKPLEEPCTVCGKVAVPWMRKRSFNLAKGVNTKTIYCSRACSEKVKG